MNTTNLLYITDFNGQKSGVQLSINEWEKIQDDLKELERLRNKKVFLTELAEAVEEVRLIKGGRLQARDAQEFLDEL